MTTPSTDNTKANPGTCPCCGCSDPADIVSETYDSADVREIYSTCTACGCRWTETYDGRPQSVTIERGGDLRATLKSEWEAGNDAVASGAWEWPDDEIDQCYGDWRFMSTEEAEKRLADAAPALRAFLSETINKAEEERPTCPGCAGAGCWDCTLPVGPNTCESCAVYVPTGEHCGNDRADGTSEYLCPDCYAPTCEHCDEPVAYCNKHERWEHINGETCFLDGPACAHLVTHCPHLRTQGLLAPQ